MDRSGSVPYLWLTDAGDPKIDESWSGTLLIILIFRKFSRRNSNLNSLAWLPYVAASVADPDPGKTSRIRNTGSCLPFYLRGLLDEECTVLLPYFLILIWSYILRFYCLGVWNEVLLLLQEKNQEEEGGPRQVTASPSRWDHRVHTERQRPLSGVHPISPGWWGWGGSRPPPLSAYYHHDQCCSVRSCWEGRYSLFI